VLVRPVFLLVGVLCGVWLPAALHMPWIATTLLAAVVWRAPRAAGLWLAALGCLLAQHAVHGVLHGAIDTDERQLVVARITAVPTRGDGGWQCEAWLQFPRARQWPAQRARLALPTTLRAPHAGERWQYLVQFRPQTTDFRHDARRRALLRDHISSTARVIASPLNRLLGASPAPVSRLRAHVAARIAARVADPSAAGLLQALAVGVTGDVSRRQWQVFNALGITHLVAISGMHVTFFGWVSMIAARGLWRRLPVMQCCLRRESFAAAVGVAMALGYALLSGFSVPAQRTVVMLAAFLLARQCARATRPAWSVGVSLAAVLLFDPLAGLSAGFWLSFAAVAAIVLLAGARLQTPAPLSAAVLVQWVVTVALLPVTVAIFGTFSAIGPLANALAIPLFTFLLVPPMLLATAGYLIPWAPLHGMADQLVDGAAWLATHAWPALAQWADLPGALWQAWVPAIWFALSAPLVLLLLLPGTAMLRACAGALLASVFLLRAPRPAGGELWVDVHSVGRAPAAMLRTEHHLLLFGTGETYGSAGRRFESVLAPLLMRSGYRAIDLWLPGRTSRDNTAALVAGAALMPVQRVEWPVEVPGLARCTARSWQWDAVLFTVEPSVSGRDCQLRAVAHGRTMLLGPPAKMPADEAAGADVIVLSRLAAGHLRL
jgi:competence protein ComEC